MTTLITVPSLCIFKSIWKAGIYLAAITETISLGRAGFRGYEY